MSARHVVFSSPNSSKREIQIVDVEEDVRSSKSILEDDTSILSFPEQGMETPSRHSTFSKTPRTSRINLTQSNLQIVDFEEDVRSYKSILEDNSSILLFPEQGMATPSRHSTFSKTPRATQSTINNSKKLTLANSKQSKGKSVGGKLSLQYIGFSLISMGCAFAVMIIWYTGWQSKNKNSTGDSVNDYTAESNFSCQYLELAGDGYCDDEANAPECGYDFNDCCKTASDRSLCQNCTCYISENKIQKYKEDNCQEYINRLHLGDGTCDLNYNKEEYFFDIGDCCLDLNDEDYDCALKHQNWGLMENVTQDLEYLPCRDDCIKSNNFCIPEELGDGICQDHNNGPYCEYDMGDCCLGSDQADEDCCNCRCLASEYPSQKY